VDGDTGGGKEKKKKGEKRFTLTLLKKERFSPLSSEGKKQKRNKGTNLGGEKNQRPRGKRGEARQESGGMWGVATYRKRKNRRRKGR